MQFATPDVQIAPQTNWRLWQWLFYVAVFLSVVAAADTPRLPVSCELHRGDFVSDFAKPFDVSSLDCKMHARDTTLAVRFFLQDLPTIEISTSD